MASSLPGLGRSSNLDPSLDAKGCRGTSSDNAEITREKSKVAVAGTAPMRSFCSLVVQVLPIR